MGWGIAVYLGIINHFLVRLRISTVVVWFHLLIWNNLLHSRLFVKVIYSKDRLKFNLLYSIVLHGVYYMINIKKNLFQLLKLQSYIIAQIFLSFFTIVTLLWNFELNESLIDSWRFTFNAILLFFPVFYFLLPFYWQVFPALLVTLVQYKCEAKRLAQNIEKLKYNGTVFYDTFTCACS